MISIFSYMEIVRLAVFHKRKNVDFLNSPNFLAVFVTEHK